MAFTKTLQENIKYLQQSLQYSPDIVIKPFRIGSNGTQGALVYASGLASQKIIDNLVSRFMLYEGKDLLRKEQRDIAQRGLLEWIKQFIIHVGDLRQIVEPKQVIMELLTGNTLILVDGFDIALLVNSIESKERAIEEPSSQTVIRGPREGFTESIRTNTTLIRKRLRDPRLVCDHMKIGSITNTEVAIMYLKGIAKDEVVKELYRRLKCIHTEGIFESGNIEEFIQDTTLTPFPTVSNSERPDTVAAGILEGRVAVLVNGTPFVLLVPALFIQFFQSAEDYYQRADVAFFLRLLRYISLFIALLFPALYIAVTTFHQEMLPTPLLISLAAQREGVPFPAFVEAMLMEFIFEVLREAGVRMPRTVGQAVSIVGALVIGQAAVEAGIVSAAMVIVVSVTAITSFVFPSFNMSISIRLLRFLFMFLGASFGFFGITVGLIALVLHLCSLYSFGVPYMKPFGPFTLADQRDTILRMPPWVETRLPKFMRPKLTSQQNNVDSLPSSPPSSPKPSGS